MFKKLQYKFLIINTISICIIFVLALVCIYIIMYSNVQKENEQKLEEASNIRLIESTESISAEISEITESQNINAEIFYTERISANFSVPFNLILNANNEIIKINSYLDMSKNQYEELKKQVLENTNTNVLKYENKNWLYKITENHQLSQKQISFLDITEEVNSLNTLLITLIVVGTLVLIIMYFISRYFAKKAIEPIKEAWEKQKQFVENASHELKTPITAIKANTDVLLLNTKSSIQEQVKWINYIKIEIDKMSELTNQLLNLAKMENKEEKNIHHVFNVSQQIESMVLPMEALALEKQIEITKEIEQGINIVQDESKIVQIVQILLDNAFKYTNNKGKIGIIVKKENRKIEISVQNTGIGIQKEDLPYVFDRFYKGDKSRTNKDNSYGLGLFIAKTEAEKIGGEIKVASIPNEITIFTLLLENERNEKKQQ